MIPDPDRTSWAYWSLIGEPKSPIDLGLFKIHYGVGVPPSTLGAAGDLYVRKDGAAGANTKIYSNDAGTWVGLTA